jgi:hypothetical protein
VPEFDLQMLGAASKTVITAAGTKNGGAAKCSYWVFRTIYDEASLTYG